MKTDESTEGSSNAEPHAVDRRGFMKMSALATVAAAGSAGSVANAAEKKATADGAARKKTFLVVEGHMDDAEIGAGGVLIQAARAHRVVIVTVASDFTSWAATVGREERTKRELVELAQAFGFEKRFLDGKYHQTNGHDLELKRKLADLYVELKPDVCFISHHEDHWPDHSGSGLAAKDAFLLIRGINP